MRVFSAITAMSLVAACATPIVPLSEQKANYPRLDVAVIDTDDKVIIALDQPGAYTMAPIILPPGTTVGQAAAAGAAGGLIAGLIMAGIESAERADAAKDILPVQEALGDARFGPSLREALVNSLRNLDWTNIEDVQVIDVSDKAALQDTVAATDAPGVLTLATSNFLSRNASTLVFSARATIIPKATEFTRSGKPKIPPATFATTVAFEVPAPVAGARRVDFLPTWAANDAELIRAAAMQAEPLLAEMIFRQLRDGNVPIEKSADAKWERRAVHFSGSPFNSRVQILESRTDGVLVRADGGSLRFLGSMIAPLEEIEASDPTDMGVSQSGDANNAHTIPASAESDETDPLGDVRMSPVGDASSKLEQPAKNDQPEN